MVLTGIFIYMWLICVVNVGLYTTWILWVWPSSTDDEKQKGGAS